MCSECNKLLNPKHLYQWSTNHITTTPIFSVVVVVLCQQTMHALGIHECSKDLVRISYKKSHLTLIQVILSNVSCKSYITHQRYEKKKRSHLLVLLALKLILINFHFLIPSYGVRKCQMLHLNFIVKLCVVMIYCYF